ncbi:MAG: hypothetical protein DWH78_04315 [Planctomycetota bacterium]|nr:MAG: hypothetical protein DWH78_04315 [Planctomycetota bacterium]
MVIFLAANEDHEDHAKTKTVRHCGSADQHRIASQQAWPLMLPQNTYSRSRTAVVVQPRY